MDARAMPGDRRVSAQGVEAELGIVRQPSQTTDAYVPVTATAYVSPVPHATHAINVIPGATIILDQGVDYQHRLPAPGEWKDPLFNCFRVLWPSFGCMLCCCGVWHMAQIGHKTAMCEFRRIMTPFFVLLFVCYGAYGLSGQFIIAFVPVFFAIILQTLLRIHIVRVHNISRWNVLIEGFIGILCCPCSFAQVSRHVYGYEKPWDGDSDPELADRYRATNV